VSGVTVSGAKSIPIKREYSPCSQVLTAWSFTRHKQSA
jgi:hypothetical protein